MKLKMFQPSKYPTVLLGEYNIPNGVKPAKLFIRQPIEWLVLAQDKEKGRALLLSKYILDWEGFADCPIIGSGFETSWDSSYLRKWLNGEFYEKSFADKEKELVVPVYNGADRDNGKRSIDKVFLLSEEEVKKYFSDAESALALEPIADGFGDWGTEENPIEIGYERTVWWTRTTGSEKYMVVCVDWYGNLCEFDSNSDENGVRPAMWIKW